MSYELLIQNIRVIKEESGLSFRKLGIKLHIKQHSVEAWFHNGVYPTTEQLESISHFAKISIDDLFKKDIRRSTKPFLLKRYRQIQKYLEL